MGSCLSVGCTVDKLNPKQVIAKINNGEIKIWLFKQNIICENKIKGISRENILISNSVDSKNHFFPLK